MPTRLIPYLKVLVHLFCLIPFAGFVWSYHSGAMDKLADPVNALTHWTGEWALWILLASLAVTPLRRLHPRLSNLIRFRRMLGLYAFFYATLHLATYVFLYSGYDVQTAWAGARQGRISEIWTQWKIIWPTIWEDLRKRRFIQVGLFAWVILLALAATSPTGMLRWMGGKNWQRLHRLVYIAAAAAIVHYWWLVKVGVREWVPDAAVLAVLLLARIVWTVMKRRPAAPMGKRNVAAASS